MDEVMDDTTDSSSSSKVTKCQSLQGKTRDCDLDESAVISDTAVSKTSKSVSSHFILF